MQGGTTKKPMPTPKPKGSTGGGFGASPRSSVGDIGWFSSTPEQRHLDRAAAIYQEVFNTRGSVKTRRYYILERFNKILEERRAAELAAAQSSSVVEGLPGETVGSVQASFAAEKEATQDLLDERVFEAST
eukprot:4564295-Heterocapsa_arctica.AAC.1